MKTKIVFYSFLISLSLTGCSPESATIKAEEPLADEIVTDPQYQKYPRQTLTWITEDGGQSQLDFNPQVDILFVTDNSESMLSAQENLVKNMDRFTAGITKNKMIDYHIGVISVWDSSERYLKTKKDPYEIGDLRYIKNENGKLINRRFITKSDKKHLAPTLKIGAIPYAQGGPEFEEIFSPLAAALEKTGRGATNESFFRENAQLVVVILTDADDASKSINAEQMARKLIDFKKGQNNKVSAYGVLVKADDRDEAKDWNLRIHPKYHEECFDKGPKNTYKNNGTCTGFGPEQLEKFILLVNQNDEITDEEIKNDRSEVVHDGTTTVKVKKARHIISITSPHFGDDLGRIGNDITVKTLAKEIFLSQRPRENNNGQLMVRVRYGNQVIPQKQKGGWLYDPESNSIRLSGDIDYKYVEGARFSVDLVPLTLKQ